MKIAAAIRCLAEREGQVFLAELYRGLGARTLRDKERVRDAVKDLVRAGTLNRCSPGLYEWCGDQRQARPRVKAAELWRFMRMCRTFTKEQIRYLSGATLDYIKRCLASWMTGEHIKRVALRPKEQTREAVYRVVTDQVEMPPLSRKKRKAK